MTEMTGKLVFKKSPYHVYTKRDTKIRDSRYLVGIGIYIGKPKKKETFIYNSS